MHKLGVFIYIKENKINIEIETKVNNMNDRFDLYKSHSYTGKNDDYYIFQPII